MDSPYTIEEITINETTKQVEDNNIFENFDFTEASVHTISAVKFSNGKIAVDDEIQVLEQFGNIPGTTGQDIFVRVDEIYYAGGGLNIVLGSYANGRGPEWDGPMEAVINALGKKLEHNEYDTQLNQ